MKNPRNTEELSEDDPEVKRELSSFAVQVAERFSTWFRLLKFIALCLRRQRRFLKRKREARQDSHGFPRESKCDLLTLPELKIAEQEIIKFNQKIAFAEEIEA